VTPASLELAPYSFTGSGSAGDADVSMGLRRHTDWAAIAVRWRAYRYASLVRRYRWRFLRCCLRL